METDWGGLRIANALRLISLMSFLLKTLVKLLPRTCSAEISDRLKTEYTMRAWIYYPGRNWQYSSPLGSYTFVLQDEV